MRTIHILLLCILGAALFSPVLCNNAFGPTNCCFNYHTRRIQKSLITSYYRADERCAMPATILVTQKSRYICVNPTDPWVVKIMNELDNKSL
ncbi:C-C motif chemokine 4-like [Mugil cephalus]|uniref:C-C motif chemokine 4-like n=1 Tax=Mugil cephalus TaxID=48193 RepID=UPI001FB7DCC5|nr:C-C motif chemokine 4-like [Mugil cephalus]